jgi:hypothetical protein
MQTVFGLISDNLPTHESIKQKVMDAAYSLKSYNRYPASICDIIDDEVNEGWQLHDLNIEVCRLFKKHFTEEIEGIYHWINKYPPGGFQEPHIHKRGSDRVIAFVYFVDIPENSGDLIIHSTSCYFSEGSVCFFDGNTEHYVTENKSSQDRITIAGNIVVRS